MSSPLAIDLVSPLPPVRSGIADYSADLLPALAELADLRLVELAGQPLAEEFRQRYPVVAAERCGEDGRLPLYQMGNNRYHLEVERLARRLPGVMTLHDIVLHHLLIEQTAERGDYQSYRQRLTADHGWIGAAAALPLRWPGGSGDAAQFALAAHRGLLATQRGVVVHSRWAAELLREELGAAARIGVVPMGMPLGERSGAATEEQIGLAFRRRHALPAASPLLGAFGFQTPIKRTDVAIRALASPALAEVHLMIAGEVPEIYDIEAEARRAGVAERVHFLGFLDFEDWQAGIAACDLCLNLRYPTAGETSASLLRILALGKPVVVSDFAQFVELPAAIAVRIPLGEGEAAALAKSLAELLAAAGKLAAMARAARRFVASQHSTEAAAMALVEHCRSCQEQPPMALGKPRLAPPTSLAWQDFSGEIEVAGAELPWPPGERRQLRLRLANTGQARWLAGERLAGGVAVQLQVLAGGCDLRAEEPWIGLPFDLDPGEQHCFEVELRRPLGEVHLRLLPHVLDFTGFHHLGGPWWEARI